MKAKPFFDTNVLLYTISEDARAETARVLIAMGGVVSVAVLNEFVSVARRKLKRTWPDVREALQNFQLLLGDPLPVTFGTHTMALAISERYQYAIFDALMIAAGLEASCSVIYSEHMHDGQEIEGLTIRNPFEDALAV